MQNKIDLQIQSTASDGKHTPTEIVKMAKDEGLEVISLTDHDTVEGIDEILVAAAKFNVRVIPGIEMSVEDKGAHILGYGINHKNEKLLAELEKFKQGRIDGAKQMVENLKKDGFVVEWEDVLKEATGSIIARPHISRAVMNRPENKEKLGGISTVHDFIEKYLFNESPNYVHRAHILAKDAIGLLHEAGGVAVWSHPAIHFQIRGTEPTQTDYESLENFLKELIDWGIDGVEAFNPSHSEDDAEFVQSLAVKYKLLRTAGSDFHEKGEHPRNPIGLHSADKLGDFETYGFAIDDIVPKLDEAINKRHNPANF